MSLPTGSFQTYLGYSVTVVMICGAFVNALGPAGIIEAYTRWGYPKGFRIFTAILEASAATLILVGSTRPMGLILSGAIMIGAILTLVRAREYSHSVPALLVLVASAIALT